MVERERPVRPPFVPVWLYISLAALTLILAGAFTVSAVFQDSAMVEVPNVIGLIDGEAEARLKLAGLTAHVQERVFDPSPQGVVLSQTPAAGSSAEVDSAVSLRLSAGTEEFLLPDLTGLPVRVAEAQLQARGLTIRIERQDSDAPVDTVVATNPSPSVMVRTGDIVRVFIAARLQDSEALVPLDLEGHFVVLDPSPVQGAQGDPPLEIVRRLRSLLEAAGAQVLVTRSLTSGDVSDAARSAAITGTVSVIIGIDVADRAGEGGLMVRSLNRAAAAQRYEAALALAEAISSSLTGAAHPAGKGEVSGDPVTTAREVPAVRVRLGSLAVAEDTAALSDPAWADSVARGLYRGIGTALTASAP